MSSFAFHVTRSQSLCQTHEVQLCPISSSWVPSIMGWKGWGVEAAEVWFTFRIHRQVQLAVICCTLKGQTYQLPAFWHDASLYSSQSHVIVAQLFNKIKAVSQNRPQIASQLHSCLSPWGGVWSPPLHWVSFCYTLGSHLNSAHSLNSLSFFFWLLGWDGRGLSWFWTTLFQCFPALLLAFC